MTGGRPQRSDQLPEEAPAEQVPDDGGAGGEQSGSRQRNREQGVRGDQDDGGADDVQRQSTGNPDNAG